MSSSATIIKSGILGLNDFNYLRMKGAVGDILCHFIDEEGKLVENTIEERLIATTLDTLKNLNNVIAVAGGKNKVQAIYSALYGGYFDILITDEITAKGLIEMVNNKEEEAMQ